MAKDRSGQIRNLRPSVSLHVVTTWEERERVRVRMHREGAYQPQYLTHQICRLTPATRWLGRCHSTSMGTQPRLDAIL